MNPPLIGPFRRGVSPIIGPKWSRRRRGGPTRGQSYDASPDDEKAGGETPYDEMRHTSRADDDTAHGENPLSFLAPGTFLPDEKAGEVEAQAGSAASDPARHDGPAAGRRHNGPANGDTPRRKGPINGKRRGRLGVRELLGEALAGVAARPTRLVLTTLGTVLGIAALVGTLGLGQTASGQITQRFDLAVATRVAVEPGQQDGADGQSQAETALPWDAPERVQRLNGVEAAGTYSRLDVGNDLVRSVAVVDPRRDDAYQLAVVAASPGLFDAVRGTLRTGRYFDAGHDRRRDRVVVLGKNAAARLGINRIDSQPAVFIGDQPYTVIGILDGCSSRAELLDAVIMPNGTARTAYGLTSPDALEIRTAVGAAQLIARQAPIAVDPDDPGSLQVDAPPAAGRVRRDVEADVNALFLLLGAVALLVGGLGIANVTLLSVLERISEIGLRRALGAARRHIASQFLVESVIIGFLGGLLGTTAGVLLTVGVSAARDWTPILDLRLVLAAPLLGALIGLAAGTYPAWKASAIEPIAALRGTT